MSVVVMFGSTSYAEDYDFPDSLKLPFGEMASDEVPLYRTEGEVFDAYHNKLLASLFGKELFADFIATASSDEVRDIIRTMDDNMFAMYLSPLPLGISKIFLSVWLSFFVLAMSYAVIVNTKYYLERMYVLSKGGKQDSASPASGGQEYLLRVAVSTMFLLPMAPYLIKVLLDSDEQDPPIFLSSLFGVLGQTFEHTERVSRVFNTVTEIDSPNYFVPEDHVLREHFSSMLDYSVCVASIQETGEKRVDSSISATELLGGSGSVNYTYESSYRSSNPDAGSCSLNITLGSDLVLGRDDLGGASSEAMLEYEKELVKDTLDKLLSEALYGAHSLADGFYRLSREDNVPVYDPVTLNPEWRTSCPAMRELISSPVDDEKYLELTNAFSHMPYCFSKAYIEVFGYPIGSFADEISVMEGIEKRYNFMCSIAGGVEVYKSSVEYLEECARLSCDVGNIDGRGLGSCERVRSALGLAEEVQNLANARGFIFAPAYKYSSTILTGTSLTGHSIDDLSVRFTHEFKPLTVGEPLFVKEYSRPDKTPEVSFEQAFSNEIVAPSSYSEPTVVFDNMFNRFDSCLGNSGNIHGQFGLCKDAYSEMRIFATDFASLLWWGLVAHFSGKMVGGAMSKSPSHGGLEDLGLIDKVLNKLKDVGINLSKSAINLSTSLFANVNPAQERDSYFTPYQRVVGDKNGALIFAALGALFAGDSVVGSLILLLLCIVMLMLVILIVYPMFAFLAAVTHALINLFAFVISMPFQISDVLSDTGEEATQHLKTVLVKWVLVLFRFPVIVGGFYLSFIAFDALMGAVPWDLFYGSTSVIAGGSLETSTMVLYHVGSFAYIFAICYLMLMASFGTAGVAYSIVREYSGADARGVDGDDLDDIGDLRQSMDLTASK